MVKVKNKSIIFLIAKYSPPNVYCPLLQKMQIFSNCQISQIRGRQQFPGHATDFSQIYFWALSQPFQNTNPLFSNYSFVVFVLCFRSLVMFPVTCLMHFLKLKKEQWKREFKKK